LSATNGWGFLLFSLAVFSAALLRAHFADALPIGVLAAFSYFFFLTALVFSARFGRLNIFYALLFAWAIGALLTSGLSAESANRDQADFLRLAAWYLIPINFAIFAWLEERSFFSVHSLIRAVLIVSQIGAILFIANSLYLETARSALTYELFNAPDFLSPIPQASFFLVAFALIALSAKIITKTQKTLEIAFFFALIGSLFALFAYPDAIGQFVFLLSAALIVSAGFMHLAYSLAYYDELTGVLGRRALNEGMAKLSGRYAIAMIDIDHFKRFNDEHGHNVGDQALKMIAAKLALIRGGGIVYRYGGEEFCVIFCGKNKSEAQRYLEETRKTIESSPFVKRSPSRPKKAAKTHNRVRRSNVAYETIPITISVGIADNDSGLNQNETLKAADRALYRAKENGRNRVVLQGK
jgi:diguanylate cyclase (GGDEF)-like protein